jgi:hypothetical protein
MLRTVCLVVIVSLALLGVGAGPMVPPTETPIPSNIFYWNRLDTDVVVLPNGDLRVVETWKLTFVKGLFRSGSRYFTLRPGQDIRDVEVTVGAAALTEVQPKNRRTNTFSVPQLPGMPGPGQTSQVNIDWAYPQTGSPANTASDIIPPPDELSAHVGFTPGIVQPAALPSARGREPGQFPTCGPGGCG